MCTVITHSFVALAAGAACFPGRMTTRFLPLAIFCSSAPDLDSGLMAWGVPYDAFLGHRGFLHSLTFALLLSVVIVTWAFPREVFGKERRIWKAGGLLAFFFLLTASHGFLDAFTDGGLGIAFFAPFSNERHFMPWNPIQVSAIGLAGFFKYGGWETLKSEFLWVWLPVGPLSAAALFARYWFGVRAISQRNSVGNPPSPTG